MLRFSRLILHAGTRFYRSVFLKSVLLRQSTYGFSLCSSDQVVAEDL